MRRLISMIATGMTTYYLVKLVSQQSQGLRRALRVGRDVGSGALERMRRQMGERTVSDSRDVVGPARRERMEYHRST